MLTKRNLALLILALSTAAIVGAWIFQAFGYAPCELCLKQRYAYYVGVPLAAITVILALSGQKAALPVGFALLALVFAFSAGFGVYHAGVEWQFWAGPSDCTGSLTQAPSVNDFLKQLQTVKVVRCDAVAIRILGLSLAGWNAVVSAVIVMLAILGLRRRAA